MTTPPLVAGLTTEEFEHVWFMGVSSDRVLGRPRDWDGKESSFNDFSFKFSNWLGGFPGGGDTLLDPVRRGSDISVTTTHPRAEGDCTWRCDFDEKHGYRQGLGHHQDGVEMWWRVYLECKPHTSSRTAILWRLSRRTSLRALRTSTWYYYRWLEMTRQSEQPIDKLIDDDI
jgi:hypothetical protein